MKDKKAKKKGKKIWNILILLFVILLFIIYFNAPKIYEQTQTFLRDADQSMKTYAVQTAPNDVRVSVANVVEGNKAPVFERKVGKTTYRLDQSGSSKQLNASDINYYEKIANHSFLYMSTQSRITWQKYGIIGGTNHYSNYINGYNDCINRINNAKNKIKANNATILENEKNNLTNNNNQLRAENADLENKIKNWEREAKALKPIYDEYYKRARWDANVTAEEKNGASASTLVGNSAVTYGYEKNSDNSLKKITLSDNINNIGISYILAYKRLMRDTGINGLYYDTDAPQQALWLMNYYNGANATNKNKINNALKEIRTNKEIASQLIRTYIDNYAIGVNEAPAIYATNIFYEAKAMQDMINTRQSLRNTSGAEIVDNMVYNQQNENRYENEKAGIVSYNSESNDINKQYTLVGPFSVNYLRSVLSPIKGSQSQMANAEEGDIDNVILSSITNAKLYGIKKENGKYVEKDLGSYTDKNAKWEFVYTNLNEKGERRSAIEASKNEDVSENIYPYPNEIFYLKLHSSDIEAITRIEFKIENLNAQANIYRLNGTYHELLGPNKTAGTQRNSAQLYQLINAKVVKESRDISIYLGKDQSAKYFKKIGSVKYIGGGEIKYCIPLTMDVAGKVWYDGTEYDEYITKSIDGMFIKENGIKDVKVMLCEYGNNNIIETTSTNSDGKYEFKFVKVGKRYYVKFEYDGMKYKPTKYIQKGEGGTSNPQTIADKVVDYKNAKAETPTYLNSSHAMESTDARNGFNDKFYEIINGKALSKDVKTPAVTNVEYKEVKTVDGVGRVLSAKEYPETHDFAMQASTYNGNATYDIIYPLDKNYSITNVANYDIDINQDQKNGPYYNIVEASEGESTQTTKTTRYAKAKNYMSNINLGLIERDPSDFAVRNDVIQTTFTLNEIVSNSNITNYGVKYDAINPEDLVYDISEDVKKSRPKIGGYEQNINEASYNWRSSYVDDKNILKNDELQMYIQYKYTLKNQSKLLSGQITEIADYYDKELYYPVDENNDIWKYYNDQEDPDDNGKNYISDNAKGYADIVIPQIAKYNSSNKTYYTSWAIKNNGNEGEKVQKLLGPIEWKSRSRYVNYGYNNNNNVVNVMYTTSLEGETLKPSETIDIFIIFKVKREKNNDYRIYIDNNKNDLGKYNNIEINGYKASNYDGKPGGRIDIDSVPGNSKIWDVNTCEDDADYSPFLKLKLDTADDKSIGGLVWEESRNVNLDGVKNQFVGDGIYSSTESGVPDVEVELIRKDYNKVKGKYEEVSFTEAYANMRRRNLGEFVVPENASADRKASVIQKTGIEVGNRGTYRFKNLIESGEYEIRFVYGTNEQLGNKINYNNIKYNGQDYKSTKIEGSQALIHTDGNTEITIVVDETSSMEAYKADILKTTRELINKINALNPNIKVFLKENTSNNHLIADINNALIDSEEHNKNNIIVVFTDGYSSEGYKEGFEASIKNALEKGAYVIVVGRDGSNTNAFCQVNNGKFVEYYNYVSENGIEARKNFTANNLYNLIENNIYEYLYLRDKKSHATDYLENKEIKLENGEVDITKQITGRMQVMQYSQKLSAENAEGLNEAYINYLDARKTDRGFSEQEKSFREGQWQNSIDNLSNTTKMTAGIDRIKLGFYNYNDGTKKSGEKTVSLGLEERPKTRIDVKNVVDDIEITLADGQEIISLKKDLSQNVQVIPGSIYSIYLDKEIIQGAKIDVVYKLTISNSSEIDSLWSYFQYADKDAQVKYYKALYSSLFGALPAGEVTTDNIEALLKQTVPVRITKIADYYDNLTFRAEDNAKWEILNNEINRETSRNIVENYNLNQVRFIDNAGNSFVETETGIEKRDKYNNVVLVYRKADGYRLNRENGYIDKVDLNDRQTEIIERCYVSTKDDEKATNVRNGRTDVVVWDKANDLEVIEAVKEKVAKYNAVETTSLKNLDLYPLQSEEVTNNNGTRGTAKVASISTYVKYGKTLSAQDLNDKSALQYQNYMELNEVKSLTGRRDYNGAVGNLYPGIQNDARRQFLYASDMERDTCIAENIIILPPFGKEDYTWTYGLIIGAGLILATGIILIDRKILKGKKTKRSKII